MYDSICVICKYEIKDNECMNCDVCDSVVHALCTSRESKRNNKFTCQQCSDIKPAHVLFQIKQFYDEFKVVSSRLESMEKSYEFLANRMKTFCSNGSILSEEVQSLSTEFSVFGTKFESLMDITDAVKNNVERQNSKLNTLDNGINTLMSAFDNDISVPASCIAPANEKILNCIEKVRSEVTKGISDLSQNCEKLALSQISKSRPPESARAINSVINNTTVNKCPDQPKLNPETSKSPLVSKPISGWRLIGDKRIWKHDWTYFDEKIRKHREAEKNRLKQLRIKQKNKKINKNKSGSKQLAKNKSLANHQVDSRNWSFGPTVQLFHKNRNQTNNENYIKSSKRTSTASLSESILSESQSPASSNNAQHPKKSYANFQRGKSIHFDETRMIPLTSPVTNINQNNSRLILSRLNDHRLYNIIRNYLAYLHDKAPSVVLEGMTCISSKVRIGAEGFPTDTVSLLKLFTEFNERFGFTPQETHSDLNAVRSQYESNSLNVQKKREYNGRFNLLPGDTQADLNAFHTHCESNSINNLQANGANFNKFYNNNNNNSKFF